MTETATGGCWPAGWPAIDELLEVVWFEAREGQELIAGYEAGALVYQLGERFGIDRRTVCRNPQVERCDDAVVKVSAPTSGRGCPALRRLYGAGRWCGSVRGWESIRARCSRDSGSEGADPRALSETRATVCVTCSDAGGGPSF